MIPVMCIVQEGQLPTETEAKLHSEIGYFSQRAFQADADIDWIRVKKGCGFTAAAPSSTVIASMHVNRPLDQRERVALLRELNDLCANITGLSGQEIVTSIRNPE